MALNTTSTTNVKKPTILGPGCTYLRDELADMKVVGCEEHLNFPDLLARIPATTPAAKHCQTISGNTVQYPGYQYAQGRLDQCGERRTRDMDEGGIAVQILSLSGTVNTTLMEPEAGAELAREINDRLKQGVDGSPGRFNALAELPFQAPELAIKELHRCVKDMGFVGAMLTGSVGANGTFLDGPEFDPVLSAFEDLDVPLYLHPGIAPKPIVDTYYNIPGQPVLSAQFANPGWGWHSEVAIHILRLAVTGALDRHPNLKLVIGHQGELMPAFLHRFDVMFDKGVFGLKRTVGEMLRKQVWLSMSGTFSIPATMIAIQTWGVDRVLFGNDYPLIDAQSVPAFLKALGDVVAPSDLRKICQTNAQQLFKLSL